jgi:ABC-type multidrug transport system ATPase subunit
LNQPLSGVTRIGSGNVTLDERIAGLLWQENQLPEYMTLKQYISLIRDLVEFADDFSNLMLLSLNLSPFLNKRIKKLSFGTKKKIALWKALVNKPGYVFMDEPTNGLDANSMACVWDTVNQVKDTGAVITVVTNSYQEALTLGTNWFLVNGGKSKLLSKDELDAFFRGV